MIVEMIVGGWIDFDGKSGPFCPGSPISYSLFVVYFSVFYHNYPILYSNILTEIQQVSYIAFSMHLLEENALI